MSYKRVLTVQDISCVGQCSLTVALPILSACGHETCILPSAVLSTHTGGFTGYTFRDLTEDMPAIGKHWEKEGIAFDAIYTGYLGSAKQIEYVLELMKSVGKPSCLRVIDPAMADKGRLYRGFDEVFVQEMKRLCSHAHILLPNITEACFLTGTKYREEYDTAYIDTLLERLTGICQGTVVLTGVSYTPDTTGVMVYEKGKTSYYRHERVAVSFHGTGDVFASAFVGTLLRGKDALDAASVAADYTVQCIRNTLGDASHWYGVKFEPAIPYLLERLKK